MPTARKDSRGKALVTGASGGLGAEFAQLLAADGYDLALVARSAEKLESVAAALRERYGVDVSPIVQDLSLPNAAEAVFARVPRCDVLVNNAGIATNGRFARIPEERIAQEIVLDVLTLTRLTRKYIPAMIERHGGRVLNVASTAGFLPGPFMAVYYACKAYVVSFSQALAEELRGSGISVTCFCPGATATGFADEAGVHGTLLYRLPISHPTTMAKAGYRGMLAGKDMVVPWPLSNRLVEIAGRLMPRRLLLWFSRKAVEVERHHAES